MAITPHVPGKRDSQGPPCSHALGLWSRVIHAAGADQVRLHCLQEFAPAAHFEELAEGRLLSLVERWLRAEKAEQKQRRAAQPKGPRPQEAAAGWNNGWAPGRLTSTLKQAAGGQAVSGALQHTSNTVLRM